MLLESEVSVHVSSNLITNFGSCLLHVINYKFLNLIPTPYPWILSKYLGKEDFGFNFKFHPYTVNLDPYVRAYRISGRWYFQNAAKPLQNMVLKTSWYCLAQFYLYPPSNRKESHLLQWYGLAVPETFQKLQIWSPDAWNIPLDTKYDFIHGRHTQTRSLEITTRTAYRFLVSESKNELSSWIYWNLGMRPFLKRYPATFLFHILTQELIPGNISTIFVVCFYCSTHKFARERPDIGTITRKSSLTTMSKHWLYSENKVQIEVFNGDFLNGGHLVYQTFQVIDWDELFREVYKEPKKQASRQVNAFSSHREIWRSSLLNITTQKFGEEEFKKCGGYSFFKSAHDLVDLNGTGWAIQWRLS